MAGVRACPRIGTGARIVGAVLCSLALTAAIAACGSSKSKSSTHSTTAAAATTTSPTTYQNTLSTNTAAKRASHHAKKAAHSAHTAHSATTTTTSSGGAPVTGTSSAKRKSAAPTHTATASSSHSSGSSAAKKTTNSPPPPPPPPKPAPLAAPVVSATSGGVHASFHGQNHNPVAGQLWDYSVLATDASGNALSGTVDTEFAFNGIVVGHETPESHPLKNGRMDDNVTFPAEAVGHSLEVRVVVHTPAGTVTLDWPVEARR